MGFDPLAPHYRWMERVLAGGVLQRSRLRWVNALPVPQRVLVVGEGPGRFLEEAAAFWEDARFCVVDASAGMLDQARRAWRSAGGAEDRVEWRHLNLPHPLKEAESFDVIVTHFFLDCFPGRLLRAVVRNLAAAAGPRAQWLLSDFAEADEGWRRVRSRMLLRVMYTFFRCVTRIPATRLECPDASLEAEGFRLRRRAVTNWGLVHADWWERSTGDCQPGGHGAGLAPCARRL